MNEDVKTSLNSNENFAFSSKCLTYAKMPSLNTYTHPRFRAVTNKQNLFVSFSTIRVQTTEKKKKPSLYHYIVNRHPYVNHSTKNAKLND